MFFHYAALNSTASPSDSEDLANTSEEDILYQKDAVLDIIEVGYPNTSSTETSATTAQNVTSNEGGGDKTTQGPSLEQKLTEVSGAPRATLPISTEKPCPLDCGPGGGCIIRYSDEQPVCLCPLGRGGDRCEKGKLNRFEEINVLRKSAVNVC